MWGAVCGSGLLKGLEGGGVSFCLLLCRPLLALYGFVDADVEVDNEEDVEIEVVFLFFLRKSAVWFCMEGEPEPRHGIIWVEKITE